VQTGAPAWGFGRAAARLERTARLERAVMNIVCFVERDMDMVICLNEWVQKGGFEMVA
jgi:hypothetical protein